MKNRSLFYLTIFFLLCNIFVYSQGEGNFWYFGANSGLDFNTGSPVALTNGALKTQEGCSTISTSAGVLLFYTDGITVWNNQHNAMPNGIGLFGDTSATQSAIILPKPGSSSIYYIFTVTAEGKPNGLRYSEVDMTLAGGLGDVTVNKNILLATPVTEKLIAVKNANGIDIWVIAHDFTTDTFLVYSVTSSGVNTTPITSNAGTIDGSSTKGAGYLKASPNGSKLVQAIRGKGVVDVLNFNDTSGLVTLDFSFTPPSNTKPYGVEFSPDGKRLYIDNISPAKLYQYDMSLGTSGAIIASATLLPAPTFFPLGALQIGPDGKIYVARFLENSIGCINNPNALGIACNYVDNAVSLAGKLSRLGLPNFIQSHFNAPSILSIGTCVGDTIQFALGDTTSIDSVVWDFGDPISGVSNTSSDLFPWHIYSSPDNYTVSALIYAGFITDTLFISITINAPPLFSIGNDTSLCSNDTLILNPGSGYLSYLWQDASTSQTFTVDTAGTYYVNVSNSCGTSTDTILVTTIFPPTLSMNDTVLCFNDTLVLDPGAGYLSYLWQNSSTNQTITIDTAGIYYVTISNSCGTTADTIQVTTILAPPLFSIGNDTALCFNDTLVLDPGVGYSSYLWQDSSTNQTMTVNSEGIYYVIVSNNCGSVSDTIQITNIQAPALFSSGNDTVLCFNDTLVLDLGAGYLSYLWQDSSTNQTYTIDSAGIYYATVSYVCGATTDTIQVTTIFAPIVLINDTALCYNDTLVLDAGAGYLSYLWQDASTNQTFTVDTAGTYYVNVANSCGTTADTIQITNVPVPTVSVNDTTVCAGQTALLIANGASTYTWPISTTVIGSNTATVTPSITTNYIIVGTDTITGCVNKDTATITVNQLPVPNFDALPASGCAPLCVQFVESNGINCASQLFFFGNGDSSSVASPIYCYSDVGTYSVSLSCTDNNGCTATSTQTDAINVFPAITANFTISPATLVKPNTTVNFTDSSTTATDVFWTFGDSLSGANDTTSLMNPSHVYEVEGTYCITLVATNAGGCVDTALKCITVFDDVLNIPNVFTPNGDGNNDVFFIKNLRQGVATLKIYNRWGKIVFEANGYNNDWNGNNISDGVFYYILDYPLNSKIYTGFVQVLSEKK